MNVRFFLHQYLNSISEGTCAKCKKFPPWRTVIENKTEHTRNVMSHLQKTTYGQSNGHVTDDVTWPQKVKVMTPKPLRLNISTTT